MANVQSSLSSPAGNGTAGTPGGTGGSKRKGAKNKWTPQGKKARGGAKKAPRVKYYHVKANPLGSGLDNGGYEGFLISIEGFAGSILCKPLYERHEPKMALFLETINPVGRVMNLHNLGEEVLVAHEKRPRRDPIKCLCVTYDVEDILSKDVVIDLEFCKAHFKDLLLPELLKIATFYDGHEPVFEDAYSYVQHACWFEIICNRDICFMIGDDHIHSAGNINNHKRFFHQGKREVYSFWPVGFVPIDSISVRYELNNHSLHDRDYLAIPVEERALSVEAIAAEAAANAEVGAADDAADDDAAADDGNDA